MEKLQTISPDSFALLCFLVLMENGEGIKDKAPSYITEKTYMFRAGLDAFAALDIHNMHRVVQYCETWHIALPERVAEEWQMQTQAEAELQAKGIFF